MAAKTTGNNQSANNILKLILNGTAWANIADNAAASPATQFFLSLHTADPGVSGTQATNETAYAGYARIPVARTSGGFVITNNSAALAANMDFATAPVAASGTLTHWGLGTLVSGAGNLLYRGPIAPTIALAEGVIPRLNTGTTITET